MIYFCFVYSTSTLNTPVQSKKQELFLFEFLWLDHANSIRIKLFLLEIGHDFCIRLCIVLL